MSIFYRLYISDQLEPEALLRLVYDHMGITDWRLEKYGDLFEGLSSDADITVWVSDQQEKAYLQNRYGVEPCLTVLMRVWVDESVQRIVQSSLHVAQDTRDAVVLEGDGGLTIFKKVTGELLLNTKSGHGGWSSKMLEPIKLPYRLEEL